MLKLLVLTLDKVPYGRYVIKCNSASTTLVRSLSHALCDSPYLICWIPRSQWAALLWEYVDQGGDGGRVPRTWVALGPRWHVCRDPTPHLERQPTAAHSTHKKRNTNYIKRYLSLLQQFYSTKGLCV